MLALYLAAVVALMLLAVLWPLVVTEPLLLAFLLAILGGLGWCCYDAMTGDRYGPD